MATRTITENVNQAISDFDTIQQAIINKGIEVPAGTPTSEYATKIGDIQGGGGNEELNALIEGNQDLEISVPKDITKIKAYAFYQNKLKENLNIDSNITSIGDYSFSKCTGLKNVTFNKCENDWGQRMFDSCQDLETVIFEDTCKGIPQYLLSSTSNIKYIKIPKTTIPRQYAFAKIQGSLSAGPIGGGYNIEFGWDTTIPSNAFDSVYCITSLTIPDTITSIGALAFRNCSFTELTVPSGVNYAGSWLNGCNKLKTLIILADEFRDNSSQRFFENNSNTLETLSMKSYTPIASSSYNIFYYLKNLKNVTISGTISFSKIANLYLANCINLTTDSILNIFNALADNTGGTKYTITLGSTNLAKLTDEQKQIAINKNYTLA